MKFYVVLSALLALALVGLSGMASAQSQRPDPTQPEPAIRLQSRTFSPAVGIDPAARSLRFEEGESTHLLIQFYDVVDREQREVLSSAGIDLLSYMPENAWLAAVTRSVDLGSAEYGAVRWAGPLQAADKISPALTQVGVGKWATDDRGRVTLQVLFFADVAPDRAMRVLARQQGVILKQSGTAFVARFPSSRSIAGLAAQDAVQWIDNGPAPRHDRDSMREVQAPENDGARDRTNVNALQQAEPTITGTGVTVGVWDGKVDITHPDFAGRINIDPNFPEGAADEHGTHVAGTVGGDGRNSVNGGGTENQYRGVAFGAQLISYDNQGDFYADHQGAIETAGIDISQNSWGGNLTSQTCDTHNLYSAESKQMDEIASGIYGRGIVINVAASNFREGTSDDKDDPYPVCNYSDQPPFLNYVSLSDLGSAKNIITVGATKKDATDTMTDFSSWGPTRDGRLKPDVVAPGESIISTFPGGGYGDQSGTSMATPHVSGISALVIQRYRAVAERQDFRPETIKALLIQTAWDLDDDSSYYNPGPDFASGYGIVDAQAAYNAVQADRILESQIANGASDEQPIQVSSAATPLKVTIVWNDPPSEPNAAGPRLINNLDLELVDPNGGVHLPWVLDPTDGNYGNDATKGVDNLNPVEQVQVDNPMLGVWTVRVKGTSIPNGPQAYSVVMNAPTATQDLPEKIFLPGIDK